MQCLHELAHESHGTDEFEFRLHTGVNTRSMRSTVLHNSQGKLVRCMPATQDLGMRYHHAQRYALHGTADSESHLHTDVSTTTTRPKIRCNV